MSTKKKHYHFIGIAGIGMSALAAILLERGNAISGSDLVSNEITEKLRKSGAKIYKGHEAKHLPDNTDIVVISGAIPENNPECIKAMQLNLPILSRGELLGQIMDRATGIAVAGTHGKTTTASLIAEIFEKAKKDPTIAIGGEVRNVGSHAKNGQGKYFIAEACEYKRAFLNIHPEIAVITNIEADHLDYYKDLDDIMSAFAEFAGNITEGGFLVACFDDERVKEITDNFSGRVVSYGFSNANYQASDIKIENGVQTFKITKNSTDLGEFEVPLPGIHTILNATAAVAVALECGIKLKAIKESLQNFSGAARRMETKGEKEGVLVIDDYGHHPTEIQATLQAIRSFYPKRRLICVFQPHQHSRTRILLNDFASALKEADEIIIPKIYAVRDTKEDMESVSGETLAKLLKKNGKSAKYIPNFSDVAKELKETTKENDIVLTIGAGPVNEVAEMYLNIE